MLYSIPDSALLQGGYVIESRAIGITSIIPSIVNFLLTGGYATLGMGVVVHISEQMLPLLIMVIFNPPMALFGF